MDRFLLTLALVAFFALCVFGMWRGWRRQAREQSVEFPPFPAMPGETGTAVLPDLRGMYVCTTRSGHWQQRVVTRGAGLRTSGTLRLYADGVRVERIGAPGFWIPRENVLRATTARAMAGKVMGTAALLVITWQLDDAVLDTGFKADDIAGYPEWIEALGGDSGAAHASGSPVETSAVLETAQQQPPSGAGEHAEER